MSDRRRRWISILVASLTFAASALQAGCRTQNCTADARAGLIITVRDARTGVPLCDGAVVAVDGTYRESLGNVGVPATCRYTGADERPGTYRLEIVRRGYLPKAVDNLTVTGDEGACHIDPAVPVTVDLEPDPSASPVRDAGTD